MLNISSSFFSPLSEEQRDIDLFGLEQRRMINSFWASPGINMQSLVILLMHNKDCISEHAIKGEPCLRDNARLLLAQLKVGSCLGREEKQGACGWAMWVEVCACVHVCIRLLQRRYYCKESENLFSQNISYFSSQHLIANYSFDLCSVIATVECAIATFQMLWNCALF